MKRTLVATAALLAAVTIASSALAQQAPAGNYNFNFTSANYNGSGALTVNGSGTVTNMTGSVNDNGTLTGIINVVAPGTYGSNDNSLLASAPYLDLYGLSFNLLDGNTFNLFTYYDGNNYETNFTVNPSGTDANFSSTSQQLTTFSVAAVPEPETWATMLLGFGAIGMAMRTRRRNLSLPQVA